MNEDLEDGVASEIVVIRRRGDGEEAGHHGGAWKIAFADFMTAMMALFLVLWLINATDEATKKQVAAYFNPMKLTDPVVLPKGVDAATLMSMTSSPDGIRRPKYSPDSGKEAEKEIDARTDVSAKPEGANDLAKRLAALASASGITRSSDRLESEERAGAAINAGSAVRDPFDPEFRSLVIAREQKLSGQVVKADKRQKQKKSPEKKNGSDKPNSKKKTVETQVKTRAAEIKKFRRAIVQAVQAASLGEGPNVEVSIVKEGILISLTDNANFGMFTLASHEPSPQLIALMKQIAKILQQRKEPLVVRGHTDGRPFRTAENDNWRLSMARAYAAYDLLIKLGVKENRIKKIEGYADRKLKQKENPGAAQNRRIEILLRGEAL